MILWLIGAIALSSAFVIGGWAIAAWHHRTPLTHWNAALVLAIGLDIGAISLATIMGMRAWQLIGDTLPSGFYSGWMTAALFALLASKIMLVWVASMQRGRQVSWLWPAYLATVAVWTLWGLAMDEITVTAKRLPKHALSDAGAFYTAVRKVTGPLDTEQVRTIDGLLTGASHWPIGWLAYGLATAWHEARLKPIEEWGKGAKHKYGKPGKYGQAPYGRGLVQLTWDFNYEWADGACSEAGIIRKGEILADFSLVMRPDVAAFILIEGMETGKFTGKSLGTYLTGWRGTLPQFTAARKIINGTDKAAMIAGYADEFQEALALGGWV